MTLRLDATRLRPLAFALVAALLGAYVAAIYLQVPIGTPGPDIDQTWWMARQLLQGHDPYAADAAQRIFVTRIFYPLTAAVASLPLALLPVEVARFVFVVGGAAIFGYAIGKHRPYLWPAFLGMPFLVCMRSAQWAAIMTAAMLLPALGWLAAVKPNLGVVMLAGARSKRATLLLVGGGLALAVASLVIDPRWPFKWREALAVSTHFRPLLLRPGGFLMLLALLRWRDPDARLLLALAVVPVTGLFYDALPACLVARSRMQAAGLAILTLLSRFAEPYVPPMESFDEQAWVTGIFVLWTALVPALVLVLYRGFARPVGGDLRQADQP